MRNVIYVICGISAMLAFICFIFAPAAIITYFFPEVPSYLNDGFVGLMALTWGGLAVVAFFIWSAYDLGKGIVGRWF